MSIFTIDGLSFAVDVIKLTRKFSVLDSTQAKRTQNGEIYRDPVGTYYDYTLTIWPQIGKEAEIDSLWEILSQPSVSHVCTFPYNQKMVTQRMYVTTGSQNLIRKSDNGTIWDAITINFIAAEPKVMP